MPISQQLRRVSQLRNRCYYVAKWHSCAKTTFAIAKYPAEWDFRCEITLFHFAMRFAAAKWMPLYCEVAFVCQIRFCSCETPSQRLLQCCRMVWQQNAHFAEVSFTLRNFAEVSFTLRNFAKLCFSPVFALFRLQFRPDFFSFNPLEISSTWDHIKRLKHN